MIHGKYVEAEKIINKWLPKGIYFYYLCGGRGIGKTYGALDLCRKIGVGATYFDDTDRDGKFLYLRRTGIEASSVAAPESSPFKKYNKKEGYVINADFDNKKGMGTFYLDEDKEIPIGYAAGLSTFANLRGVDFSDVVLILYDECIPENKNKRPLKDEGLLFLNAYETINRNRAIEGKKEVVVIFLSNPIDLGSDLLSQLSLTPIFNSMIFKHQQRYTCYERSLHIERYVDHPVSKEKECGVLYKFAKCTGFNEQSLSGEFVNNDLTIINRDINLSEYKPFLTLENITVYKHKSLEKWYISQIVNKARYTFKAYDRLKVKEVFYWKYKLLVIDRCVQYDDYATKKVFESMINFRPLDE